MARPERLSADLVALAQQAGGGAGLRFFPLVAFLDRLLPEAAQVGGNGPVAAETVRFRHDPSLSFSAGDVARVALRQAEPDPDDFRSSARAYFEVTTTFLGLTGSGTPLPYYLAEEIAQEDPDQPHQREFLDLFHHRLLALLFRVQAKYALSADHTPEGTDPWSQRLLALAGLDTFDGPPTGPFPAARLLRLAPLLAMRARTPKTLEAALEDLLEEVREGTLVRVTEFIGSWTPIDPSQRTRLARDNTQLGHSYVLGARAFDRAAKFRVELGPVSYEVYRRLLREGDLFPRIDAAVSLFGRGAPDYELRVWLKEESVPRLQLSRPVQAGLGRDTWLGDRRGTPTSVTLQPPAPSTK